LGKGVKDFSGNAKRTPKDTRGEDEPENKGGMKNTRKRKFGRKRQLG